jgi:hypothetical protein
MARGYAYRQRPKPPESGVFERPHKVVVKQVLVDGKVQVLPVKVYDPLVIEAPPTNPVFLTGGWGDGIRKVKMRE